MYDVVFVLKGSVRKKVLKTLSEPKTPQIIAKEINKDRSSVSRALLDMKEKDIVKCDNPGDKRYRFYSITKKGKMVMKDIERLYGSK